jgi:HSF-type DNA-binding
MPLLRFEVYILGSEPNLMRISLFSLSWFRQSKYTSFQRQLNIYGFKRITCESGADATWIAPLRMTRRNAATRSLTTRCRLFSRPRQECELSPILLARRVLPCAADSENESQGRGSA